MQARDLDLPLHALAKDADQTRLEIYMALSTAQRHKLEDLCREESRPRDGVMMVCSLVLAT